MKSLLILFTFITSFVYAQFCPSLGPDQILPCGVGSTTLTANLSQCGPGGVNPNQTTNYNNINIPYVAQTNTGTQLFMGDDTQQGPFQIGFNFCFFGQTYTQFWVGSNGWISFSPGQPTTFTSAPIPNAGFNIPKNCIMGPWQDWHPGVGGQIRYQVQGVAPCRKLVVSWINMPMFGCTQTLGTFHIVIYESSNYIENHIQSKQFCNWANGTAVQGIHNQTGTAAITVVGRNSTQWVANNDAYRWVPSGPVVTPTLTWYQVGNPNPIGTGPTINVTPPQQGANYTCHFVYPTCNAGWNTCNQLQGGFGPDTVLVVPGPPNLPNPTIFNINPTCNSYCDGSIFISPNGGNGVQTISWNGNQTGFNPTGLCAGNYSFTITDAAGCTVSNNVTLTNPPIPVVGPITYNDTICYQSNSEVYSVPQQVGYQYLWSSVGTITNGQGTDIVDIDWSTIGSGFIPGGVQVTGYDVNNCPSLPVSVDLNVFNVLPVIQPIGPFCSYDEFVTLQATPVGGVFSGDGVMGNDFYPGNAVGNNTITYVYTQSGCMFDTTTTTIVYPQPILDSITPYNPFYEICEGDSVTTIFNVISNLNGYNEWTYMNNTYEQNSLSVSFDMEGMFTISVVQYSNGCVSNPQQTVITVENCPEEIIYVPNSFTPDGDEHNNTWLPVLSSGFDPYNYNITIYNRWGEVIFESNNHLEGWDGTYNYQLVPSGIYNWTMRFGTIGTDYKKVISGYVNVLR
jgi:gliding motility-associated-like protein